MMIDYEQFRQRALAKKGQFENTLKVLKRWKDSKVDALFDSAHHEVFSEFDCLTCALCCKHVGPRWTSQDIKRASKELRMKERDFEEEFLQVDEDGDHVFKSVPCPFLMADNKCSIYEARPKACREYPHTDRKKMKQIFKLTLINSSCCPAVEQVMEKVGKGL